MTVAKFLSWSHNEIKFMVEATITQGTVLKGYSVRKAENHWNKTLRRNAALPCADFVPSVHLALLAFGNARYLLWFVFFFFAVVFGLFLFG